MEIWIGEKSRSGESEALSLGWVFALRSDGFGFERGCGLGFEGCFLRSLGRESGIAISIEYVLGI